MKTFTDLNKMDQTDTKIFGVSSTATNKERHSHNVAQLSIPTNGSIYILIEDKLFIVPCGFAVFIPANSPHAIEKINNKTIIDNLYFDSTYDKYLPNIATTLPLSSLSRLIIAKICSFEYEEFNTSKIQNLLNVLFDEFSENIEQNYSLVVPKNKVLYKIYQLFVNSCDLYPSLDECAQHVNISSRTLLRIFKSELNISFIVWKQQFLFIKALALLEKEKSTSTVAYKLGYNSDSAFISMFKKMSGGQTPSLFKKF